MKKKTDLLLLLPSLAGFLAFFIVPFVYSFYYAFTENAFTKKFVWFDNFKRLFENEYFKLAMKNTGKFTVLAVPLTMAISLILALLLVRFATRLPFVKSALFLPVILPSATIVMLWNAYISDFTPFHSLLLIFLWKYGGLNVMLMLTACKTPTNVAYLQDSNDGDVITLQAKELKLKPADKISIVVNTKSVELNNVLNLPMTTQIIGYSEQQSLAQSRGTSGYTIDSEGFIDYPLIGKVKVAGLSREQVAAHLKATLEEKNVAKDAVVTVEYLNLGFSVLGEVNRPGFYAFENDQVSILQALGLAGDMNLYGRRDAVKVIRTEDGQQKTYVLSMLDNKQLTSSPAYYLQQNDIVYVEPNNYRKRQSTANATEITTASFWLSALSVLTTIAVLVFK